MDRKRQIGLRAGKNGLVLTSILLLEFPERVLLLERP